MTAEDVRSLAAAFWARVVKHDAGCWIWTGARNPAGYGGFNVRRQQRLAHRVAWTMERGAVPDGLCVLHRCDNPPCVNPDHLFLGTQLDNVADMIDKGRVARGDRSGRRRHPEMYPREKLPAFTHPETVPRGEQNGQSRLTSAAVIEIRRRHFGGESMPSIGARFNVTSGAIFKVVHRMTWRHVESDVPPPVKKRRRTS